MREPFGGPANRFNDRRAPGHPQAQRPAAAPSLAPAPAPAPTAIVSTIITTPITAEPRLFMAAARLLPRNRR